MEKILLVINAYRPNEASVDFACRIAERVQSKITGLFIENLYYRPVTDTGETDRFGSTGEGKAGTAVAMDTDRAVKLFADACAKKNIQCEAYLDKGEPIQQVIFESRFADLLIIDPHINFYDGEEQIPSHFTKEILAGAECPVLLAPDTPSEIEEVVFCYEGSASSVFAIKQFTYLLPAYREGKAVLLEVSKSGGQQFDEEHVRLMAWLRTHYPKVIYQTLQGNPKEELFVHFFMRTGALAVMGSYGRSLLSNFFKHSAAEGLIRTVDLPLFITHH